MDEAAQEQELDQGKNSTEELLNKILESTEQETKYAKRAARFTLGIFLVLAIAMAIVIPQVTTTLANVNSAVNQASDTVAKANEAIDNINLMSTSITGTSEKMNTMLDDNSEAIASSVQKLSNIDFEGLNSAIQDLQDAVGPFASFMNKFK